MVRQFPGRVSFGFLIVETADANFQRVCGDNRIALAR